MRHFSSPFARDLPYYTHHHNNNNNNTHTHTHTHTHTQANNKKKMPKTHRLSASERAKAREEAKAKHKAKHQAWLEAVFNKAWKHVVKHYTAIQPPQNFEGKKKVLTMFLLDKSTRDNRDLLVEATGVFFAMNLEQCSVELIKCKKRLLTKEQKANSHPEEVGANMICKLMLYEFDKRKQHFQGKWKGGCHRERLVRYHTSNGGYDSEDLHTSSEEEDSDNE